VGTTTDDKSVGRRRSTVSTSSVGGSGTGRLPRAYYIVRAARAEANTFRPLLGSEVWIKNDLGTFLNDGDESLAGQSSALL
jgi:hypothetical protein